MLAVVQHLHLRYGDQYAMTLITFQDGKPVMRDGKVGAGQGCCCESGCGRCITDGTVNYDYRTREECEKCACMQQVEIDGDRQCPDYDYYGQPLCPEGTRLVVQPSPSLEIYNAPCFATFPYGSLPWTASTSTECGAVVSVGPVSGADFYPRFAKLGRVQPTLTAFFKFESGSGAEFAVTTEAMQDDCGFDYWRVASVEVTEPGSGYVNQSVFIGTADGDTVEQAAAAVVVTAAGEIVGVTITDSGRYYRESTTATPYVASPTVKVINGGAGNGAAFQANIDSDPDSASFGLITSVTVLDGGIGYGDICAQAIPVSSCAECGEAPCGHGCACGTWVVDSNQEPCKCCEWELEEASFGLAYCPDPNATQEEIDGFVAMFTAEGDAIRATINRLRDDFESAGWTVQYDDNFAFEPPEGCIYIYGFKFGAKCEGCELAYPRRFSIAPCDPDQWVQTPAVGFRPTTYNYLGVVGCRNEDGTWREWGERGGAPEELYHTYDDSIVWIPKCGQRITECVCCVNEDLPSWDPLRNVTADCEGACPPGYTKAWGWQGACAEADNQFP